MILHNSLLIPSLNRVAKRMVNTYVEWMEERLFGGRRGNDEPNIS